MKIIKNYIYNIFYQLLSVIIPIFTIPYVSRVLGAENIGISSFTAANTQYFVLLATMGISLYATREISYLKEKDKSLSNLFWEIFIIKCMLFIISYLMFIFFMLSDTEYRLAYFLQSISIVGTLFDISWFFMGLQNFKVTVLRNTLVKIVSIILIFTLVKEKNDTAIYIAILSISLFLGNVSIWPYLSKFIRKPKFSELDLIQHFKPILTLFIPQIAIQVFTVVNKTILGIYSTPTEVGLFENSDKIIRVIMAIVTASGSVLLPAISQLFISKDHKKIRELMYRGFDYISFISIPLSIGIASISNKFSVWFFGSSFKNIDSVLIVLSLVLVFMAWNNTFSSQFLIPAKHEDWYTKSFVYGAILNALLNLVLDKQVGAMGAAISAVFAETFVIIYQINKIRYFFSIKKLFKNLWKYYLSAFIMGMSIFFINEHLIFSLWILILDGLVGIIVYLFCNFLLRSEIFSEIKYFMNLKKRKKR